MKSYIIALTAVCTISIGALAPVQAVAAPITIEIVERQIKRATKGGDEQTASNWERVLNVLEGRSDGMTLEEVQELVSTTTGKQRKLWKRAEEAILNATIANAVADAVTPVSEIQWEKELETGAANHYGAWLKIGHNGYSSSWDSWASLPPGAEPYGETAPSITATFTGDARGLAWRKKQTGQIKKSGSFVADVELTWSSDTRELAGFLDNFRGPTVKTDWRVDLGGIPNARGKSKEVTAAEGLDFDGVAFFDEWTPYIDREWREHFGWTEDHTHTVGHWTATPYGNVPLGDQERLEPEGIVGEFHVGVTAMMTSENVEMVGAYHATRD